MSISPSPTASPPERGGRRPQFTIRSALLAMLLVALGLGWFSSVRRSQKAVSEVTARLRYAETELKMSRARLVCGRNSFQAVYVDGAQFQEADLSALDRYALESCRFKTPPSYDDKTRFPAGFDPQARCWRHVTR